VQPVTQAEYARFVRDTGHRAPAIYELPLVVKAGGAERERAFRQTGMPYVWDQGHPVERREQRWKLSGFQAVYLRDELVPAVPGQTIVIAPEALATFRPSYRLLSYVLSQNNYRVNSDLPGDDRPDTVAALENELFGWAGVKP